MPPWARFCTHFGGATAVELACNQSVPVIVAVPLSCCRLLEKGRRYQEKLQEAQRRQEEQPRDAATGQPLFRPKTHRAPQWERNPEGGCMALARCLCVPVSVLLLCRCGVWTVGAAGVLVGPV